MSFSDNRSFSLPITPISELKDLPFPKTSACLIIGDEILNGKTVDTNSGYFAKYCFNLGIELKRIEVVPDDEQTIIEAVRRLSKNFDFVITSGGIGPTHDDITYPTIAKAFNLQLASHQQTLDRMVDVASNTPYLKIMLKEPSQEAIDARKRMALFPTPSLVVYPNPKLWVPIVIVNNNVHVLPGIPRLFRELLDDYQKYLKVGEKFFRAFVKTFQPESFIAPILTELQEKHLDIKIGSYPKWTNDNKRWVIISFITGEKNKENLKGVIDEVVERVNGTIVEEG
ncbi:3198_t:CDS:2 [Entrophospora sp. SA101]|nr:5627_t:CDS:2 [Entrophospora sp. SA101]CAJ0877467.1 3198_t:CDS:2 [Entrophospora sp. SA101]